MSQALPRNIRLLRCSQRPSSLHEQAAPISTHLLGVLGHLSTDSSSVKRLSHPLSHQSDLTTVSVHEKVEFARHSSILSIPSSTEKAPLFSYV